MRAIPANYRKCEEWINSSRDTRKAKKAYLLVSLSIRQNIMKLKKIYNLNAFSTSATSQGAMKKSLHVSVSNLKKFPIS